MFALLTLAALTPPAAAATPAPISFGFAHADTVGYSPVSGLLTDTSAVQAVVPVGGIFAIDARVGMSTGISAYYVIPYPTGAAIDYRVGPRLGGAKGLYASLLAGESTPLDGSVSAPSLALVAGWTFATAKGTQFGPEVELGGHGLGAGFTVRWATRPRAVPSAPSPG